MPIENEKKNWIINLYSTLKKKMNTDHLMKVMRKITSWMWLLSIVFVRWVSKYGPQEFESSLNPAWRNTANVRKHLENIEPRIAYLLLACIE